MSPRREEVRRLPYTLIRDKVTIDTTKQIAEELLISFKELPGFEGASIDEITPIYHPDGKTIAYREVKYLSQAGEDAGYAIISATEDDLPVVEFSNKGKTYQERFKGMGIASEFKMIRFSHSYITAEDAHGKKLNEIGKTPTIFPSPINKKYKGEGSNIRQQVIKSTPLRIDPTMILSDRTLTSYEDLKANYTRRKLPSIYLTKHWKIAKSPQSPCEYDYYWTEGNMTYYLQIPKNTPPNNNDHSSGCGPTAWMNLYGINDINWTNSLLEGQQTTNNVKIKKLTMKVHDYLGTYEPWWTFGADQGFTWPGDMPRGIEFALTRLQHRCSYWYRHDWWNTDEQWVFQVARDSARKKKPFIVGYDEDRHYAIGLGIAECKKHGWRDHSWIWIYPAWSTNDNDNKWIPMGTIFGVYSAYDFYQLSTGTIDSKIIEYDWGSGWTTLEFYEIDGNTYRLLLKERGYSSIDKNVHITRMNPDGTNGPRIDEHKWSQGWTCAKPFKVGNNWYLFLLKKSNGIAKILKINPDGTIGDNVVEYDWASGWTTLEFYEINGNTYRLLLKEIGFTSNDKNVRVTKMNPDGTNGPRIDEHKWSQGWTCAKPFKVGNNWYLFLLKKSNGIAKILKINPDGTIGDNVVEYDWASGWTTLEFYDIRGTTYRLLLRQTGFSSIDKNVHITRMNPDGTNGSRIDERKWAQGWTSAKPFKVGGNWFLFMLRKADGKASIWKIRNQ